jgi:SMODS and SLOG-associating 2TM effector domain family 4
MEAHSPGSVVSEPAMTSLEGQLREMYGRAAYTHKTHEKMADRYVARYKQIKTVEIWLSALAAGSLLFAVFGESREGTIIGAVLSTVLLGLTLYFREAMLGEQAQKHTTTAAKLWGVRESLLSLLVDLHDGRDAESVRRDRDRLNKALEEIYRGAPRTNANAYEAAQRALKAEQELFFTETELDHMLPHRLRSSSEGSGQVAACVDTSQMKGSIPRSGRSELGCVAAPSAGGTVPSTSNVGSPNSGKDKSTAWVATGGLVLTLFGVLGYGAGRAYVKTYWNTHGLASQFSLSLQDLVYFGYTTNVGSFSWVLVIAAAASGTMLTATAISRFVRGKLGSKDGRDLRNESGPRQRDPAIDDFAKATVASLFLFLVVTVLAILLSYSTSQARQRAEDERQAFATWDTKAMSQLELNFAVVDGKEPNGRQCGFVVEGSEKLLALSDGRRTETVPIDGAKVRSWPLRKQEHAARHVAICECGLDLGTKSTVSCPIEQTPKR